MLGLVALVFPQPEAKVGGLTLRFASLSDYFGESDSSVVMVEADSLLHEVAAMQTPQDSARQRLQDTLNYYHDFFAHDAARIFVPGDSLTFFDKIFAALDSAGTTPVHIMHYGDSQIEGDRITSYLRERFQARFGGNGPGLIPVLQPVSPSTMRHTCSDSVSMYYAGGMLGERGDSKVYGSMARYAMLSDADISTNVQIYNKGKYNRVHVFARAEGEDMTVSVNGIEHIISASDAVRSSEWKLKNTRSKAEINFRGSGSVYGIALGSDTGVMISNIALRGSDGLFFTRMDINSFAMMNRELNTQMMILEFGGNAVPMLKDSTSVLRYCKSFAKQLHYVKRACPNATTMVIGPADMSIKVKGKLQTHPLLPYLAEQMKATTVANGAAYWDMYSVMGGENSMISWVEHKPRWAATDYIHFTHKGVEKIANVLCQSLMMYYNYRDIRQKGGAEE